MQADLNTQYNYMTSIYVKRMNHVFYSNTSAGNNTESERVFLNNGQKKIRIDYLGNSTFPKGGNSSLYTFYENKDWY
jgi:hypothetical protein